MNNEAAWRWYSNWIMQSAALERWGHKSPTIRMFAQQFWSE